MFLATIPAVLYVDRFGRKTILIVGGIGMAVSHFIVAGYVSSRKRFAFRTVWMLNTIVLTLSVESQVLTRTISGIIKALRGLLLFSFGSMLFTSATRELSQSSNL